MLTQIKMKVVYFLIVAALTSCTPKMYIYDIKLEKPVASTNLSYEDSVMSMNFEFEAKWINFELYNKSEDGIKILWDEVSMSENGTALRVVHKNTGTTKITDLQPPTSVPPKSRMKDQLIPSGNISYFRSGGTSTLSIKSLYPTSDNGDKKLRKKILEKKGQKIVIYFPYYIRNQYNSKNFEFLITDVTLKSKRSSVKPSTNK